MKKITKNFTNGNNNGKIENILRIYFTPLGKKFAYRPEIHVVPLRLLVFYYPGTALVIAIYIEDLFVEQKTGFNSLTVRDVQAWSQKRVLGGVQSVICRYVFIYILGYVFKAYHRVRLFFTQKGSVRFENWVCFAW